MQRKGFKLLIIMVLLSFSLSGCYYFSAKKEIANAERLLSELKGAGGERQTPYEYCSAEKFLDDSRREFSDNDFGPAKEFAERSKSAAQAGLSEIKRK